MTNILDSTRPTAASANRPAAKLLPGPRRRARWAETLGPLILAFLAPFALAQDRPSDQPERGGTLPEIAGSGLFASGLPSRPGEIEPNVVALEEYRDPLEPLNRAFFRVNDFAARYVLVPTGKGYVRIVPRPARRSVGNFFENLGSPIRAVNNLVQGKPRKAGISVARFAINTTVGIGGLFDPASERFELELQPADFSSTLAHYGVGYGIYLELPLLGPSDLRNGTGRFVDYFLHPVPYLSDNPETMIIQGADFFQSFAPNADEYETLRAETQDPYRFFRNLYLQGVVRDALYERAE